MYAVADQVAEWLAAGRDAFVAQIVETAGFSSRDHADALAWTDDRSVGSLGVPVDVPQTPGRHVVTVTDAEAATVGLSCGGRATVLVRAVSEFPADTWPRLAAREPICLVADSAGTRVFGRDDIRDAADIDAEIPWIFGRGTSATAVLDGDVVVVALWPVPRLVVVGEGTIADALAGVATVLGWPSTVVGDAAAAIAAIEPLHPCDAMVVLSHDREVDGPALTAALASDAGYVGALGSRRTQAARREWLTERGVTGQERIHGPAGLDVGANAPGEIAVSIVAEILATRVGGRSGSLRERGGSIHQPVSG